MNYCLRNIENLVFELPLNTDNNFTFIHGKKVKILLSKSENLQRAEGFKQKKKIAAQRNMEERRRGGKVTDNGVSGGGGG